MTGILDGHNIEVSSTPLDRLEETVATGNELATHIADNIDPHGGLLRQTVVAINDQVQLLADANGLRIVDYTNSTTLDNLRLNNLDVRGSLDVADNIVILNSQVTGAPSVSGGIEINRGTSSNVNLIWNEGDDNWVITDGGVSEYRILDQRDRDALDAEDVAIRAYVTDNYVHRTGGVAENITGDKTFSDNVIISGDLTVNGSTTTVNTQELNVSDNIINLNSNVAGAPTQDAGINIVRGTSDDMALIWDEGSDQWMLTDDGTTYHRIADQRNVDTINLDMTTNYVHKTGNLTETVTGLKTFQHEISFSDGVSVTGQSDFDGIVNITNNTITLNADETGTPSENVSLQVERGTANNVALQWDESADKWTLTENGSNYYDIITTNDEGHGNGFDADTVDGLHTAEAATPSTVVARDASGNATLASTVRFTDGTNINSTGNQPYYYNGGNTYTIWTSGNDGSGSGLDADLLDGLNTSSAAAANTVVTRDGANNTAFINASIQNATVTRSTEGASGAAELAYRYSSSNGMLRFMNASQYSTWAQANNIKVADSVLLNGLAVHSGTNNEANKVVRTDGSGYAHFGTISTTSGDAGTSTITKVYASYDNYVRYYSLANFAAQVLSQGSTANAHTHNLIISDDTRAVNSGPNSYPRMLRPEFKQRSTVGNPGSAGSYCGTLTFGPYSDGSGGNAYQLAFTEDKNISLRTGSLSNSTWDGWARIWHSGNDGVGSGLDADLLDGNQPATSAANYSIAQRTNSGQLYANEFRSESLYTRLTTDYGYIHIGPQNTSLCHFYTDRPAYYFDHTVHVNGSIYVYGTSTYLSSTAGYIAGNTIWHTGNDGSGSGLDADLLDGQQRSEISAANTVASRDASGDITARLFRSDYGEQTSAPATTADICFRNTSSSSDNYMRFMSSGAFSAWCQNAAIKTYDSARLGGLGPSSFNQVIGTDSDINTSGSTIIDNIYVTDGVITSMGTRTLTLADLGYTGDTNANYSVDTWRPIHTSPVSGATTTSIASSWAYSHGAGSNNDVNTSGATIVDSIYTNNTGHVTSIGTRTLTAADVGAASSSKMPQSGISNWNGVGIGGYRAILFPSNGYTDYIQITPRFFGANATIGDITVISSGGYFYVYRSGSYTGDFIWTCLYN